MNSKSSGTETANKLRKTEKKSVKESTHIHITLKRYRKILRVVTGNYHFILKIWTSDKLPAVSPKDASCAEKVVRFSFNRESTGRSLAKREQHKNFLSIHFGKYLQGKLRAGALERKDRLSWLEPCFLAMI